MQVVTGTELQEPCLLTGNPVFSGGLDSLGRYNDPPTWYQAVLATKLLVFWRLFDSLDAIVIGSSQANWGINPTLMTGLNTLNMAWPSGDLLGQKNIIINYIVKHCSNIKLICSSLDIGWLNNPDGNVNWKNSIAQSKGYLYDSSHEFWPGGVTKDFKDIISQVPLPTPSDTSNRGFIPLSSQGWGADPPPLTGGPTLLWDTTDQNYQQNLGAITMLADTLRSRGIHWIMINFPVSPSYKGSASYSIYGPSWQTANEIVQNLQELNSSNPYFHFYDANSGGHHDYDSADAFDENHLSAQGAAKLSLRVDSIIHTILP
ncbi:MAG: hypothetical protein ABSF80_09825 [Chitinispirillaceae bacterium]|jgi:hypothetical protein